MAESPLKQRFSAAMKDAMRAKDKPRLGTIRLALSEIKKVEVDERIDPDDERIIGILDKMLKQRRESIKQYEAGNRKDLADLEKEEITVLKEFLPLPLSEDELKKLISDAVIETGAVAMKDMGKVMAIVRPAVTGRADMAEVSANIKALLN